MAEALEDDDETLEISADNPNQHMDELCLQHKAQVEQMCEEHLQQMDHICVENKYPFTFSQLHQMYQDALSARQVAEAELQSLQTWRILDERAGAEQQANAPEAALRDESSRAQDAADAIARALEEKNQPVITTVRFRPVDAMHPQFRYQIDPFGEDVANGALIKILDKDRSYLMAYAFDQQHVNEDVFNILSPTINNAVANRNVTIVVTAKSGTGKSYFIKNTLPLGVEKLNRHFLATKVDHDYEVEMSVSVEVYGRRIFDLNVPDTTRQTKPARALRTAPSARSWSINSRREKVSEASQMQLEKTIWGSWTPRLTSTSLATSGFEATSGLNDKRATEEFREINVSLNLLQSVLIKKVQGKSPSYRDTPITQLLAQYIEAAGSVTVIRGTLSPLETERDSTSNTLRSLKAISYAYNAPKNPIKKRLGTIKRVLKSYARRGL